MPSTNSSSMPNVLDSSTVTTPSLPTLSSASASTSPMVGSAAEIAATLEMSSRDSMSLAWSLIASTATTTAFSMPRFSAIGFAPAATLRMPWWTIARASTVAVVVPSPATSFVLVATSFASWAPMFSHGSSSSTSFAMVTPSFVIVGAPHFLSSTTLWPFGPSVSATVSASLFTPASSARRAFSPNFSCLVAIQPPPHGTRAPRRCARALVRSFRWLLLDDREHVAGRQDQVLVALDLDLGAAVLRVDDLVADGDVQGHARTVLEPPRADRHDRALLGLLLRGVGDHDAGDRRLLLFRGLDHDPVLERLQLELLGHAFPPCVSTQGSRVLTAYPRECQTVNGLRRGGADLGRL